MTDGRTDAGPWVYYKLTYEPSAQVSYQRTNGPVNAHLISGSSISINHTIHD